MNFIYITLTVILFILSLITCIKVSIEKYRRKSNNDINCEKYDEEQELNTQDDPHPPDVSLKYNPNTYKYNRFRIRREKIYNE